MTGAERRELDALNAYWPREAGPMPHVLYRRWCELQIMARDAASGMEARQGQDRETGLGAEHDSPTRQGDAQPQPLGNPLDTGDGK